MAPKGQMTGMLGTYLAAAELTNQALIVTVTSRNAKGADLLASDQSYKKTWSIQVKTNRKAASFWLLSSDFKEVISPTHVYLFLNLRGDARPDYYVVPSSFVATHGTQTTSSTGSVWYEFRRKFADEFREQWAMFNDLSPAVAP